MLRELANDEDYTVRADALRGLRSDDEARALLLERLRDDADPFVRRVAAQALRHFPDAGRWHGACVVSGEAPGDGRTAGSKVDTVTEEK